MPVLAGDAPYYFPLSANSSRQLPQMGMNSQKKLPLCLIPSTRHVLCLAKYSDHVSFHYLATMSAPPGLPCAHHLDAHVHF